MIAVLAALPIETELLRRRLSPCEVRDCAGFELYLGRLGGTPLVLVHCGIGKSNAASAMTALHLVSPPAVVYVIGCGGAYLGNGIGIGDLALASSEIHGDEGVSLAQDFLTMEDLRLPVLVRNGQRYFNVFPCNPALLSQMQARLQSFCIEQARNLAIGPFVTVSSCSGTAAAGTMMAKRTGGVCENMEGAAIAQVCARYGIPFMELRGISNLVEDRDPSGWNLLAGAEIAQNALLSILSTQPVPEASA
jgi:futalosine hydrolase